MAEEAQAQAQPKVEGLDLNRLDLTPFNPEAADQTTANDAQLDEKAYDPSPDREKLRGIIAGTLVFTFVVLIVLVGLTGLLTVSLCHAKDACNTDIAELKTVRAVIELVLTPLVGLVGAVTGFYYGEKSVAR